MHTSMNRIALTLLGPLLAAGIAVAQRPAEPQQREQITIPAAQQPQQGRGERARTPGDQPSPASSSGAPAPEEKTVVTRHSARIGGQQISYTATAGTIVIRAED